MKTTQTFGVRIIALPKVNNSNEAYIFARITVSKKVIDISLKRTTLCSLWDSKRECVNSKTPEAKQINKFIDDTRYRLMECYQQLLLEHKVISPHAIKTLYLGETKTDNNLLSLIDYHNINMKTILSWGTLKNYFTTKKYVEQFLKQKYKNADIFLSSLNYQFITEFEFFLRTCVPLDKSNPLTNNGVMKHMERLRKMVTLAYKMEWIAKDPFAQYKLKFKRKEMSFLTAEELYKLEHIDLSKKIVDRARDLFIFSCYTGLSFIDMANLRSNNLCIGIDGEYWIKTNRQKTETLVNIPLLPKAYSIIEKYKNEPRVYYRQHLADSLCKFMQGPYTESYMPMADLFINYHNINESLNYKRALNLDSAIATTTFQSNNIIFKRTAFASFPDKAIVIRNEADKQASISFDIMLSSKLHYSIKTINDNEIILKGKAPTHVDPVYLWKTKDADAIQYASDATNEGMTFEVCLKIINEGGKIFADNSSLHVVNADAATILITSATSFNGFDVSPVTHGKNPSTIAEDAIQNASPKSYSTLLTNHVNDYKPIYERVSYNFGKSKNRDLPTDERLKKTPDEFDASLLSTIVQYGRYLLIASSRPGGQPANLKGLWNEKFRPEYSSNWCIDHDAQMFYYPVETNNLSEMHEPFLQLIKELSENGYKTADINYGMHGWCAHHNTDIWRKSSPVGNWGEGNPHWANWNMSGAWLCEHYFEHYLFTLDTNFLREQAYPVMKGAAQFCLDWLTPDSTGKYLISVPSFSPENTFITENGDTAQKSVNTTNNIELIKDLFSNIIKTANILRIKNSFIDSVENAYKKLAPYPIAKNGNLLEWSHDWRSTDPAHRHLSHMYAVFPGSEISPLTTPKLAEAAKKALTLRLKTNGSWGFAWKAACWARLNEGDSAWQTLKYQLQYVNPSAKTPVNNLGLYPNLFNSEVPGVILNGNTCITAAVTEILLQSQTGVIDLLPALPTEFEQGSVKGLVARGDFIVNINWNNNQLTTASLTAKQNTLCKIKLNKQYKIYLDNKTISLHDEGNNIYSFNAKAGNNYVIRK